MNPYFAVEKMSDAELAARVAEHDPELAKLVRARMRVLRLQLIRRAEAADPALVAEAYHARYGHH